MHPLRLDYAATEVGIVGHCCLVLQAYDVDNGRDVFLMAGVQSDRFVKLEMPSGLRSVLLALSHDGTRIAVWTVDVHQPESDLRILDLAAAAETHLPGHGFGTMAGFAPDGTLVVVSSHGDDQGVELRIINADGTLRDQFIIDAGTRLGENTVSWSPDGRLVAYNAYMQDSELEAVVVIRPDTGEVVRVHQGLMLLDSSNGTWLGNETLVLVDEYAPTDESDLRLLDVRTGAESVLDVDWPGGYLRRAVTGGTVLWAGRGPSETRRLVMHRLGDASYHEIAILDPEIPAVTRLELSPLLIDTWATEFLA